MKSRENFASWVAAGKSTLVRFAEDRSGATAIEYGMIAGLMSIAIAATLLAIGETLRDDLFTAVSNALQTAAGNSGEEG